MPGIKDRVAIVGMGCTKFGERWDASADDLLVEAAYEAFADAGIEPKDIQAAWVGSTTSGATGILLPALYGTLNRETLTQKGAGVWHSPMLKIGV